MMCTIYLFILIKSRITLFSLKLKTSFNCSYKYTTHILCVSFVHFGFVFFHHIKFFSFPTMYYCILYSSSSSSSSFVLSLFCYGCVVSRQIQINQLIKHFRLGQEGNRNCCSVHTIRCFFFDSRFLLCPVVKRNTRLIEIRYCSLVWVCCL